jgi:hypothetical protein
VKGARWLVLALYVNAILWSIPVVRPLSRVLQHAGWSRWALGGFGVLFAVSALGVALARRRYAALFFCAAAYGALLWYLSPIPDEVVHVAEYGALGVLFSWAMEGGRSPWLVVAATGVVGVLDEITQGATPGRFYDRRDIVVNLIAGAIPLWLVRKR